MFKLIHHTFNEESYFDITTLNAGSISLLYLGLMSILNYSMFETNLCATRPDVPLPITCIITNTKINKHTNKHTVKYKITNEQLQLSHESCRPFPWAFEAGLTLLTIFIIHASQS